MEEHLYKWNKGNASVFSSNVKKSLDKLKTRRSSMNSKLYYIVDGDKYMICKVFNNKGTWAQERMTSAHFFQELELTTESKSGRKFRVSFDQPGQIEQIIPTGSSRRQIINAGSITEIKLKAKTIKKICSGSGMDRNRDDQDEYPFEGKYTFRKCKTKCIAELYLKKCHFLSYHLQQMVKETWLSRYNINFTLRNANWTRNKECIKRHWVRRNEKLPCFQICLQDCEKSLYEANLFASSGDTTKTKRLRTRIMIYYKSLLKETIVERHAYTWQAVFGMLRGTLGLMTGTSVLSMIEVVFVGLTILFFKCCRCSS